MSKNVENVLKLLGLIILIGGILGYTVTGIVLIANDFAGIGLGILFGGDFLSLTMGYLLIGLGVLIETNKEIVRNTMPHGTSAPIPAAKPSPVPSGSKPAKTAKEPVAPIALENGFEMCPVCQTVQYPGRKICTVCSTPFVRKPAPDPKAEEAEAVQRAMAPVSGAKSDPISEPLQGTLAEAIGYALRFKTEDGMMNYLKNFSDKLSANEKAELNALLAGSEETLRRRLQERLGN